jgi:ubiquinone/menaquinone biosynthesis C-methylase UbiE
MNEHSLKSTISMQVVTFPDGSFGVSLMVTGLQSQQQADAALAHMERMFCGQEIGGNQ